MKLAGSATAYIFTSTRALEGVSVYKGMNKILSWQDNLAVSGAKMPAKGYLSLQCYLVSCLLLPAYQDNEIQPGYNMHIVCYMPIFFW